VLAVEPLVVLLLHAAGNAEPLAMHGKAALGTAPAAEADVGGRVWKKWECAEVCMRGGCCACGGR